jgi:outer membrane lipoprotein-sorting protein
MAILNAPLESSGTLIYTAPGRLEKHTLVPRRESLVLERDRLTLENRERNQRRTFALQDQPVIWAFVESIRSTLAGDLATLSRFYQVTLDGSERQWRLTLKPVEPGMQNVVSEIRIDGSRNRVSTIEIIEAQGDRSVMTITPDGP